MTCSFLGSTRDCVLAIAFVCLTPLLGLAELHPSHIAILANADNPDSLALAHHYAERRHIPTAHIIRLSLPSREHLTRDEYERLVVAPVRHALQQAGLASTVRVLVTTYGIPLRVAAPTLSADEKRWRDEAQRYVRTSREGLAQLRERLEQVKPGSRMSVPPSDRPDQEPLEMTRTTVLLSSIEQSLRSAVERQQSPGSSNSPQDLQQLVQLIHRYGGWGMLFQRATPVDKRPELAAWQTLLQQTDPLWLQIGRSPVMAERALMYRWVERLFGLRGVLELASSETDFFDMSYADAALDSELSLLWWDRSLVSPAWRRANPLFTGGEPPLLPVVMVSRLDGPTVDHAKGLVDKALYAEQNGLRGTVYLDARGLKQEHSTNAYGRYDQSLRDAADLVKQRSDYRVVLDNTEKTFATPGDAPDVALYVGWYRLRAYENAFVFLPGAIGYHMASAEAVSVHDRGERGWCKNALERGITATLGSVGEPYLDAFPEPAEFLKLVLSGQFSLVESYYLTSRFVSWRMVLFGDPLYNPMKSRSKAVPQSSDTLPMAPSDRPFGDPAARLAQLHHERQDQLTKLVDLLRNAEREMGQTYKSTD